MIFETAKEQERIEYKQNQERIELLKQSIVQSGMLAKKGQVVKTMKQRYFALIGQSLSYYAVEEDVFREDGKYSSEGERASRIWKAL